MPCMILQAHKLYENNKRSPNNVCSCTGKTMKLVSFIGIDSEGSYAEAKSAKMEAEK